MRKKKVTSWIRICQWCALNTEARPGDTIGNVAELQPSSLIIGLTLGRNTPRHKCEHCHRMRQVTNAMAPASTSLLMITEQSLADRWRK